MSDHYYIIDEVEDFDETAYTAIVGRNVRAGELLTTADLVPLAAPRCVPLTAAQAREIRAMVVCSVCMRPIEPRNETEWKTMESVGVHNGECWMTMKRDAMLAGFGIGK